MTFRHQATLLSAAVAASLAVAALIAAPAQAAPSAPALITSAAAISIETSPSTVSPNVTDWLIWDGSRITSLSKCQARISTLRMHYPGDQFRCTEYEQAQCPSPLVYWLVESREILGATLASDTSSAAVTRRSPAAAAC